MNGPHPHIYVVFRRPISSETYTYLCDLGIANGEKAHYSHQTTNQLDLAIPFSLYEAYFVVELMRVAFPSHEWKFAKRIDCEDAK
ncbi:MAG: hypothetical protein U5M53_13800 [Rhodoferax sp.]|nr:hypothetical protein [Rhodoferax sp.]